MTNIKGKITLLICLVLSLMMMLVLSSCDNTETPSNDSASNTETNTDTSVDSETDDASSDTSMDSSTNTSTDTSIDSSTDSDDEAGTTTPEPEPAVGYTVIWKNYDGTILETDANVAYGTTPEYNGEIPTKDATAEFTYNFKGWEKNISSVTGDQIYIATYENIVNEYTVIWKNNDGAVLETDTNIAYGAVPEYNGDVPTKESSAEFTYTFVGWDKDVTAVTGDVTYTATYNNAANEYTVTWKNYDGIVLETDTNVAYGTTPKYNGDTPKKPSTVEIKYIFNGWDKDVTAVTGDVTYTATYYDTAAEYTVTWKNYDGTVLETDINVSYGTIPEYNGATPAKPSTGEFTYSFSGWDKGLSIVNKDIVYTAEYYCDQFIISYDANGGENVPQPQGKEKDVALVLRKTIPKREGYTFVGWNNLYDSKTYAPGSTYTGNMDVTFFAMWRENCNNCEAVGTVKIQEDCSNCSNGIITDTKGCSTCDGMGTISKDVLRYCSTCGGDGKMNSTAKLCSSCNGYGGDVLCQCSCGYDWWANQTGSRKCSRCGRVASGNRLTVCSTCNGSGTVKVPGATCGSCYGSGSRYETVTNYCNICAGEGSITVVYGCSLCDGKGYNMVTHICSRCNGGKLESEPAPTWFDKDHYTVSLVKIDGYEYSMDGVNWQRSILFENLRPQTTYRFYQRRATKDEVPFGITSAALSVTTNPLPQYRISYNLSGGSANNPTTYTIESDKITLAQPTRTGYTFVGWIGTGVDEKVMTVDIPTGSYGDRSYTACWVANQYIASFDANGGTVSVSSQIVTYDSAYSLTNSVTRIGYTFMGWYDGNTKYSSGTWGVPNDITLIAKWKANSDTIYTVNHYLQNINDDEYTHYKTQQLMGTSDAMVTPIVQNYDGFNKPSAQTVNVNPDGSTVVNYYYTRNYYTITVVGNGGTSNSIIKKYQTPIDTTKWTTRDGHILDGLYNDVELTDLFSGATMPAQNKTVYAHWKGENKPTDFLYTITDGIVITGYKGSSTIVNIPAQIGGKCVIAITASAFQDNTKITSVVVPNNVTNIETYAFSDCTSLKSITIGDSVTSIGDYAFKFCTSLTSVTIPDSVTVIEKNAFYGCSLTIYTGLTSKPSGWQCYVGNVIWDCKAHGETEEGFKWREWASTREVSVVGYTGKKTDIVIPSKINDKSVTIIGNSAFKESYSSTKLTSVIIPDSVTTIENSAFNNCYSLVSVTIPDSVTSIGNAAFYECTSLRSVNYLGTIEQWCDISFDSVHANPISNGAKLYLNGELVTELVIPDTVTEIKTSAFEGYSSLISVTIGDSVISIGYGAFENCDSLTSVTIQDSVTSIGDYAFYHCDSLTSITIGDSVTSIAYSAFSNCTSLRSVNYLGTIEQWCDISFGSYYANPISNGAKLYLNGELVTELVIPDTVTEIKDYAFVGCTSLASVTIGHSITEIGYSAFRACTSLKSITILDSVTLIGNSAFEGCTALTSVTIPDSVTSIGNYAFDGCTGLTSVTFENTTGWYFKTTSGTAVSIAVTDSSFNATQLKSKLFEYTWYRK